MSGLGDTVLSKAGASFGHHSRSSAKGKTSLDHETTIGFQVMLQLYYIPESKAQTIVSLKSQSQY